MTALAATAQPGTTTTPPRVLLQVTAAPNPPTNAYTSNFATVDGWSGASAAIVSGYLRLSGALGQPAGTTTTGSKTLTGLSIGAQYRYRAFLITGSDTQARLKLTGGVTGAFIASAPGGSWVELLFTATATTHVIAVDVKNITANVGPIVDVQTVTVQPSGTWQGTTIRRTDVNGTSVVVREDVGGQDTSGGTMTLYDLEAATVGPVSYTVTDGAGALAYATTTFGTEARRNRVHNPSFETNTTFWAATRGTITRTVGNSAFGSAYGAYASTDGSTAGGNQVNTALIPVDAGVAYTASAHIKAQVTASPYSILISWYTAASALISSSTFTSAGNLSGTVYTRLSVTGTAPPTATQARVVVLSTVALPVASGFNIDGVMLEQGTALLPYFDGSTGQLDAWVGSAHGSQSIETGPSLETMAWITLPATAVPSLGTVSGKPVALVLDYSEASQSNGSLHTIIGRADPIANPGPLALRAGDLEVWCADYATANALRDLLATGEVAMLRQPTHLGMDLYFVAQTVRVDPAELTSPRRWVATVSYAEVLAA